MAIELRPEVRAFAEGMQRLLDAHDEEKGDAWKKDNPYDLLLSIYRQTVKLDKAIGDDTLLPEERRAAIHRAAASVGAHAMFVADVCDILLRFATLRNAEGETDGVR